MRRGHGLATMALLPLCLACRGPTPGPALPPASAIPAAAIPGPTSAPSSTEAPRATCAGRKQCPPDRPICVVGANGAACAARGSREYEAAAPSARWVCTLQSDCPPGEGCFAPWADDAPWASACGGAHILQNAPTTAYCEPEKSCQATEPDCVPCRSAGVAALPWVGHYQ